MTNGAPIVTSRHHYEWQTLERSTLRLLFHLRIKSTLELRKTL